ncbi:hypothetical protein AX17_006132 [Amanita inopinata Kibby_2008]|nr:hypothetical protein AX17_006132 [Amanita inopinata Kibby_2008]
MRIATGYIPHALYATAITSLSIHLVHHRKSADDEKTSVKTRISILESIAEQLRTDKSVSREALDRMKRLARAPLVKAEEWKSEGGGEGGGEGERISWKEVVFGRRRETDGEELSHWEKKDLEKVQQEANKA